MYTNSHSRIGRILQLSDNIDQTLSQMRHHISRVMVCQSPNDRDGPFTITKHFIVESDKETSDIGSLSEMAIKLVFKVIKYRPADSSI